MYKTPFIAALALAILALSGCASTPTGYMYQHSLAYNVALNGGIKAEQLHDVKLTEEQSQHLADTVGFRAADTALGFTFPAAGLNKWQSGGGAALGLAQAFLESQITHSYQRIILMAWMPTSMAQAAKQARAKFDQMIRDAMEHTMTQAGLKWQDNDPSTRIHNGNFRTGYFVQGVNKVWHCPISDKAGKYQNDLACYIYSNTVLPEQIKSPDLPGVKSGNSYFFGYHRTKKLLFFEFSKWDSVHSDAVYADAKVDELSFLQGVSQQLPAWAYIYVPAKEVSLNGKSIDYPFVLNQGKVHLFAVAADG